MRIVIAFLGLILSAPALAARFDLVLQGGRVIDPESGLDAVRNVGVIQGRIAAISAQPLDGARVLNVQGLVVAPGFIDLHQHAQDPDSGRLKAFDGVTSALEMEIGTPDVTSFLHEKQGHALINYGTTASHSAARALAFGTPLKPDELVAPSGAATNQPASEQQIQAMLEHIGHELDAGALGVGIGLQYHPGATRSEIMRMFQLAATRGVPVFTHVRSAGRIEPGSSIESVGEVIADATVTGASLQIVHINSSCLKDGLECLSMVAGARARGIDVTTEAYPYIAGMTYINSALFNPGWREKFGIDYDAIQVPGTGERLNQARFEELHRSPEPLEVIIFMNTQEMVDQEIANPLVTIASDGERGHPRLAGTYCHILARYVRELGSITLTDAIRKMSLMPAERLEKSTADAHRKGRVQEGADADLIAFNPATVSDRSTYQDPAAVSVGMRYVIVNGTLVIDQGKLVPNALPGKAILGRTLVAVSH